MKTSGFTLLEAMVALVLITTTGLALLNWINTQLMTFEHIQQAHQRQVAIRNVLAFMATINPYERPKGEEILGNYTCHWQTQAVKLPKNGVSPTGELSVFEIGLYDTQVQVDLAATPIAQFTLRQVGFKQVRNLNPDDSPSSL